MEEPPPSDCPSSSGDGGPASAVPEANELLVAHHRRASSIVFGSCNSQHYDQPFWDVIRERNPTAFVWAGDAVYADDRMQSRQQRKRQPKPEPEGAEEQGPPKPQTPGTETPTTTTTTSKHKHATPEYLRLLYEEQKKVEGYRKLLLDDNHGAGERISVFGTIDDHDYGIDNGDETFEFRRENGMEFTRFLGLDDESSAVSRRAAKGRGVYGVQVYDFAPNRARRLLSDSEAGLDPDVVSEEAFREDERGDRRGSTATTDDDDDDDDNRLVAVFVLDVRSNKMPWAKSFPERYSLDPGGDFLGEDQWKWFETAIGRSNARVNLVVSGIQVHAPWFYDANKIENWSAFPKAQHRLYQAVLQSNVRAPILVSGDVHFAQILRKDCRRLVPTEAATEANDSTGATSTTSSSSSSRPPRKIMRPLYEVTTSGMTHSWGARSGGRCGRPNGSKMCSFRPLNKLFEVVLTYAHFVSPWTALVRGGNDNNENETKNDHRLQYTLDRNIAEIGFDWIEESVTVRILGDDGQQLLGQDWSMEHLGGGNYGYTKNKEAAATAAGTTMLDDASFEEGRERLRSFPSGHGDYVCVNYRGNPNKVHFALSVASIAGLFVSAGTFPLWFSFLVLAHWFRRHRRGTKQKRKRTTEEEEHRE